MCGFVAVGVVGLAVEVDGQGLICWTFLSLTRVLVRIVGFSGIVAITFG